MKLLIICLLLCPLTFINATTCIGFLCSYLECNHDQTLNLDVSNIKVYFYDYKNETNHTFPINEATNRILSIPTLGKTDKFFVYVGGFKSNLEDTSMLKIKKAFKQIPNSYLLIMDHSAYTYNNYTSNLQTDFKRSAKYVHYIGKRVAQMLVGLSRANISPKNMHCMGHSLGGQILGHVGWNFFKITRQKIGRITALDPAGPCFVNQRKELQIRSGVADYVEVYHCNDGGLGTSSVLGDVDFYINDGQKQPQCTPVLFKDDICSHSKCIDVWATSILKPKYYFSAYQCETYQMFKDKKCNDNDYISAGFRIPRYAKVKNNKTKYFFSTKDKILVA